MKPGQLSSILRVWARLPPHLREIAFDLNDPDWTPPAIGQVGDVLCEFPNVFSTSKTDFGSCSLMQVEISVPESSAPVTSRSHRINPILTKEVHATLNQYLAAGLIQHSTLLYSSPLVVFPKRSRGVRITVNYKNLNQISKRRQLPLPRVDHVPDSYMGVFAVRLGFLAPPDKGAQVYGVPYSVLHTHGPLRVARYVSGQQRFDWVVRQGDQ